MCKEGGGGGGICIISNVNKRKTNGKINEIGMTSVVIIKMVSGLATLGWSGHFKFESNF